MSNATLDKLIWTLLFGGGLGMAFGLVLAEASPVGGGIVVGVCAVALVLGVVLIGVRSRRP